MAELNLPASNTADERTASVDGDDLLISVQVPEAKKRPAMSALAMHLRELRERRRLLDEGAH